MVVSIEQHVDWVGDCIAYVLENGLACIEPELDAEDAWVKRVNEAANRTLMPLANSWYVGANIPGKPRVFAPYVAGCGIYREEYAEVAADGYAGFTVG